MCYDVEYVSSLYFLTELTRGGLFIITVKEVADLIQQDDILLMAGADGIDKTIDYINVQEIAEKSPWINPSGFILTAFSNFTGMDQIIEHLEWYVEMNISAIGFHTAIQKEIPNKILEFANKSNLPLFAIPPNCPYHIIYERVNDYLNRQTLSIKEQVENINESMLNAVILEKEVHHIVYMMGDYLQTPIIYLNESYKHNAIWSNSDFSRPMLSNLMNQIIDEEKNLIDQCRIENQSIETNAYSINNQELTFNVFPINNKYDFFGYLFVAIPKSKFSQYEVIIKHGITALLLDALKRNATKEFLKTKDIQLFEDIFTGRVTTELTKDKVHYYFFDAEQLLIAKTNDVANIREQFMKLQSFLKSRGQDCLLWILNNQIIGIVPEFITKETANELTSEIPDITIGLSGRLLEFRTKDFKKLFDQAIVSLEYAEDNNKRASLWDDLKTYRVIRELGSSNLLSDFDQDILGPLIAYDREQNTELIQTLDLYLKCFFSLKNSADLLFVHPNTVRYRIDKVKEILPDIDMSNPEHYMSLVLALKLYFQKYKQ